MAGASQDGERSRRQGQRESRGADRLVLVSHGELFSFYSE